MRNPIIEAAIKAAVDITPQQKKEAMDILSGKAKPDLNAPSGEKPLLVSRSEAAHLLKLSRSTLWRMEKSGKLTPIKIEGCSRYRRADIERLAGLD